MFPHQEALVHRKGWLQRRTGLEKVLLAVLGVVGAAMMITGAAILGNGALETGAGEARVMEDDICVTAECAIAGRDRVDA